ncbi:hypothetical protein OROHE_006456 [Orobanche hederae]
MSRSLKRLTSIDKALLIFPPLLHLFSKFALFIFPLLRRVISKSFRFMDSLLFSNEDNDVVSSSPFDHSFVPPCFSDPGESIFLVPFRWWKDAVRGGGGFEGVNGVGGVLYNVAVQLSGDGMDDGCQEEVSGRFTNSEILVGMRREGEAQVSGEEGVSAGDGDLALVSEWMFFTALKWRYNEDVESLLPGEDSAQNLFSLKIRLLCMMEARNLVIKISQKDNEVGVFNKAYSIFCTKSGLLHIWDFSGQTNQLLISDTRSSMDSGQPDEVRLELQIYGLSSTINDEDRRNGNMTVEHSRIGGPSSSSPLWMNGSVNEVNLFSRVMPAVGSGSYRTGALGLTGLYNLGNTCFMNSAIQCLVHTPKLVDYFLGNFRRDLNCENPLGMNGKLAIAFGDLLRKLWAPGATPIAPRMFKSCIASFAPQFSGYNQHDSQEFLSFLLDGLHEDLNRVKRKPYIQAKDEDGRPHEEVADEYWENHLSRNDSIIVDLCQGQYRSTLVCPVCKKLSITFDPFMYLSLPLPSSTLRTMTVTILSTDGTTLPHPVTIRLPDNGTFKDLVEALGVACSLRDNETLLIAEIYNNKIFRILDDPSDSIELIRDNDELVAYRLPKCMDGSRLVVFMHQTGKKSSVYSFSSLKKFGIPLVAKISDLSKGSEIREQFLNLIKPFLLSGDELLSDDDASRKSTLEDDVIDDAFLDEASILNNESKNEPDFEYYLENRLYYYHSSDVKIQMDEPVPISSSFDQPINVLVSWPEKMIQNYDTSILSSLPAVCKTGFMSKWTQDSISLYNCVDAFLKEEPLGPDDMWLRCVFLEVYGEINKFRKHSTIGDAKCKTNITSLTFSVIFKRYCPNCKGHRQASKKLDLWRLPEILVIHLKRFSYTRFFKNKLETFVDFPIDEFDLSNFVTQKKINVCHRYMLYAVSNHYGGLGGGHYTAFAKHRLDRWYEFDDSNVFPVKEEQLKTQAAYVLFYKRI